MITLATWVLLLLQVVLSVEAGKYLVKRFETNQSSGYVLNHLVFDKRTNNLFVGAVNRLYKLDTDLTIRTEVVTGPKDDNPQCVYYRDLECNKPLKLMNSYNKVLVIDYTHQKLIACSSLYQGFCEKRNLANIKERDDPIYTPVVANNDSATTFAFIANGPAEVLGDRQEPVLYIGASRTNTGAPETRDLVHAFCSRKLSNFELVYQGVYSSTKMDIEKQQRETFPIYYRFGFGSKKNFSYVLTVQKSSTSTEMYVSKLIRICQDDKNFYSYAEVQLKCEKNGVIYNVAQAAYLGKAGFSLAKKLEIPPTTEEALYVVFSKSLPNSASPGRESAMCVYQMRKVRSIFTENIYECFQGIGNTGPSHVIPPSSCLKTTLQIKDDYCGTHDINTPIDGRKPIQAEAALTFNLTVSAIAVSITNDFTVAFIGTTKGHIIKVAIEAPDYATAYEDVPVDEGSSINPDLRFDDLRDPEHLYCMTDYKISKIKLHDCSQYKTCASCLGARDPYCGWCSLENKCSVKTECTDSEQELRWIPYNGNCTRITDVTPDKIQKKFQTTEKLQLNISNLPSFTGEYQCVFSGYGISTSTRATRAPSSTIIYCDTPLPHLLPAIPTGEDHIVMNLSVQIQNQDFVGTSFTFFDCGLHTSCTSCTLSAFPCTWCINNHMCTHSRSECQNNDLVIGDKAAPAGQTPQGHALCPRIESNSSEILVPSGTTKKITVYGVNLKVFQSPIRCLFNLHAGREVAATVRQIGDKQEIECDPVSFQYASLSPNVNVPFQIIWANNKPLDNPAKIQVIMYKCGEMADTCGDCLTMEDKYGCGWCEKKCMTEQETCGAIFLPNTAICPDPHIDRIYPTSGPREGGTLLTIEGTNLGKEYSDISGGITVAMVQCTPDSDKYVPPRKIVCRTGRSQVVRSGTVEVTIKNMFAARALEQFSYVDPEILGISPSLGPMSGGTWVTISGKHLNAGTDRLVDIGSIKCEDTRSVGDDITCRTSGTQSTQNATVTIMFDNQVVNSNVMYSYVDDPEIVDVKPKKAIVSGGITVTVTGTNLDTIQDPQMLLWDRDNKYISECKRAFDNGKHMHCYSPKVDDIGPMELKGKKFGYGFQLDNVSTLLNLSETQFDIFGYFTIFPDPKFEEFPGNKEKTYQSKTDYLTISGENLILGLSPEDVTVKVGREFCNVTSLGTQLTCQPPKKQPASLKGSKYPEVVVQIGRNLTVFIGYLKYEQQEVLPMPVIIGLAVGGGLLILIVICFVVLWCVKSRENTNMKKKWQIQMDNMEAKVAKECKEAFAELQTDMTELTSDLYGQVAIPFWDYRTYCMRVLFPQDDGDSHPVIKDLEVDYSRREDVERGLKMFSQLVNNKTFLLIVIRTLEGDKRFSMRDRVNVASLISVALQAKMEYATEVLKTLLADLIEKSVEGKNHPKLLLRRTESVAEKMLTNWFTFLLYKFLRECAGEPLFMLYQAIKQQTSKGPVDACTSEARYSLSEQKLIRQQVDFKPMTILVQDLDQYGQSHPVKVLDCDTVSQVKEKILDAIYKNAPFSSRPIKEEVDMVLFDQSPEWEGGVKQRLVLSDVDSTAKTDGEYKQLNTLNHYKVPDGAYMALMPKQKNQSVYNLSLTNSEKSPGSKLFDYQRLTDNNTLYSRSPSLNRTVSPQGVQIDIESTNGTKYYHLVKQADQESHKESDRGMVSEIYLTRLLATKGTLQQFVDDLFERIFSTAHRGTVLPLAIKYMFDFLDDQALLHNIQDPEVVHTWKSNSLPLRFWVNVIKNPNFVFDIYKSNIVDSCLSVVAQNFMDSCSMSDQRLGKDSPSSKLLYAKDIPTYKKWVERYYQDVKMMPAISDQDMTAMMTEESRSHQDEFNTNAALYELYKYVQQYSEELSQALEEDEFARKNKLNFKLDQVHVQMNGEAFC